MAGCGPECVSLDPWFEFPHPEMPDINKTAISTTNSETEIRPIEPIGTRIEFVVTSVLSRKPGRCTGGLPRSPPVQFLDTGTSAVGTSLFGNGVEVWEAGVEIATI